MTDEKEKDERGKKITCRCEEDALPDEANLCCWERLLPEGRNDINFEAL